MKFERTGHGYNELVGRRIILRPVNKNRDDQFDTAEEIIFCLQDPVVLEKLRYFSFFQNAPSLLQEVAYLERMASSETDLLMTIGDYDGRLFSTSYPLIGMVGLHEIDFQNKNCRFGIIIFNKLFWNQGYAKETEKIILKFAFCVLNMNKVYLTPRLDNSQAIEIYKKLGFRPEGILREEYKVKEGQYLDLLRMSILKKEWEEHLKTDRMITVK